MQHCQIEHKHHKPTIMSHRMQSGLGLCHFTSLPSRCNVGTVDRGFTRGWHEGSCHGLCNTAESAHPQITAPNVKDPASPADSAGVGRLRVGLAAFFGAAACSVSVTGSGFQIGGACTLEPFSGLPGLLPTAMDVGLQD